MVVFFLFFLRNRIFGAILLYFTSIFGSIIPLFLMAKNKKIDHFALFFSQTELRTYVVASGGATDRWTS